jgi:hypothetical protein
MNGPWAQGLKELIQHAVDHLAIGGDFDRRIAMMAHLKYLWVDFREWRPEQLPG